MIKFKFKIVKSKKKPGQRYIRWECTWDGKHDDKCFDTANWNFHPFADTFEYKDDLDRFEKAMAKLKRSKKKEIYEFTPSRKNKKRMLENDKKGVLDFRDFDWKSRKISKKEIQELHPDNMREIGDYVAYNPATLGLCKLLADKKNIDKHSGNTAPYCYWMKMLSSLCILWD